MDAFSGYNQIAMEPSDQEHTSFTTDKGLYCYKVMSFGLKNTGATYQRLVNAMFVDHIGKIMEVYVDDLLVKSITMEDHIKNLGIVFDILLQYGMRLNPDKCVFGVLGGKFLGFVVSERGIEANPEKVQAILDMAQPKTRNKGLEHDKAFQGIRDYLASVSTLYKPIPGEVLYIYLAVSVTAISAAPVRRENTDELPVYYTGKGFNDTKSMYSDIENFALALLKASRRLRQYFQAHTIHVLTNQPLKQVLQKPVSLGRLVKWSIDLGEFDIYYTSRTTIKGQAAVDFITEFIPQEDDEPSNKSVSEPNTTPTWTLHVDGSSNSKLSGAGVVLTDPEGHAYEYALQFNFKASNNAVEYEALIAGIQLAKELGVTSLEIFSDSQLVVNQVGGDFQAKEPHLSHYQSLTKALLQQCLTSYTIALIARAQNTKTDAVARLATSPPNTDIRSLKMEVLEKPSIDKPFSEIFLTESQRPPSWMDLFIDCLSKGIEPSDRAITTRLRRRATLYTIRYASPAHPQTNGQVEAVNKIIKQNLKKRLDDAKGLWVEKLPEVLWAIRTTPTEANGETPFCMSFGTEAVIPVEQEVQSDRVACFNALTNSEGLKLDFDLLEERCERAHLHNINNKQRIARYYNARVMPRLLSVEDWVMKEKMPPPTGLKAKWQGSYEITEAVGPATFYLRGTDGITLPHPWNAQHLRYYPR
ncbi:uncharacterized protein LOC133711622 [Rosa rugosa]|uniref:uncharacterized protein LOC133711622 n=1 Tax=Rosa rugosa TaxID=74645 RepID=UPI002B4037EC|nr:uncharacterized protein LOC133711622 [Rosa rugosa]